MLQWVKKLITMVELFIFTNTSTFDEEQVRVNIDQINSDVDGIEKHRINYNLETN